MTGNRKRTVEPEPTSNMTSRFHSTHTRRRTRSGLDLETCPEPRFRLWHILVCIVIGALLGLGAAFLV